MTKPLKFKDTGKHIFHEKFQEWRSKNFDGFFINCQSMRNMMIHRASCRHLGDMKWKDAHGLHSLTKKSKVCSDNIKELEQWINDNDNPSVKYCKDCFPNGKPA